ncbi:glycosyltransferase family 4 protein [Pseudoalteromonas tetraodonis]|uniref:glycosyltransferase family 4 protein n=1 Tax=Pseudoalteromonas tetraodonis TaxID=43659 RepID=UPI003CFEDA60
MSKFILIGADPESLEKSNPGGQATACHGLITFLNENNYDVEVIDTTQSSFPVPRIHKRVFKGLKRTAKLILKLLFGHYQGVIVFSSSGFSFYERALQCSVCRVFKVTSVLCIRSGHFMNDVNNSEPYRMRVMKILKIPDYLAVQGNVWNDFFMKLGIESSNILMFRNFLPNSFPVAVTPKVLAEKDVVRFVFVGWLVEEKGIKQLLSAVKYLSKKEKKFHLDLVGGGSLESYVRGFVSDNELNSMVSLHGWLSKKDVINVLSLGHVFVLPSKAEGFPNAMLEAMSLGLPTIVTDVGSVKDTLQNYYNGILLSECEDIAIFNAMSTYIDNPTRVKNHSTNVLRVVNEKHNAKENCESLFSIFKT